MRAAIIAACAAILAGCSSTPTGVRVVASSATATNIGDIAWDEYKIPVFSVYTGPKTTIWINRNYLALSKVTAGGCVTNDTSALGVYSSKERKETRVELEFSVLDERDLPRGGGIRIGTCPPARASVGLSRAGGPHHMASRVYERSE